MRARLLLVVLLAALATGCAGNMAPVYTREEGAPSRHYVVRAGDTLYSISWRHGLDYRTVARWNRIDPPYTIYSGQRLRLIASADRTAASRATARPQASQPQRPASATRQAEPPAPVAADIRWRWPTEGRLTRRFAADAQGKQGVELTGVLGQPIAAAAAGRVVYAGNGLRGYGNLVIVKHNSRYLTAYGYNREMLVKEGDVVSAGQQIATMGIGSGRQPSLHFELRRDGKPVDPAAYVSGK